MKSKRIRLLAHTHTHAAHTQWNVMGWKQTNKWITFKWETESQRGHANLLYFTLLCFTLFWTAFAYTDLFVQIARFHSCDTFSLLTAVAGGFVVIVIIYFDFPKKSPIEILHCSSICWWSVVVHDQPIELIFIYNFIFFLLIHNYATISMFKLIMHTKCYEWMERFRNGDTYVPGLGARNCVPWAFIYGFI